MIRHWILAPLLAILATTSLAQEAPLVTVNKLPTELSGEWLFRIGHDPAFASPFREHRNWQRITVPGPWERHGYQGYDGHAWYRISLRIAAGLTGEDFGLELGLIGDVDEVFLNGRRIASMGSFPPDFDKASLSRRYYLIPRETIRFGEYNELAIHVYNDARFGGLLGPTPRLDSYHEVLRHQVQSDVVIYAIAVMLLTLALAQIPMFLSQRESPGHLILASLLVCAAVFVMTYAHWGLALLLGHSIAFRTNVAALLLAIAHLPSLIFRFEQKEKPRWVRGLQILMALAAAFALVWRSTSDLILLKYTGDVVLIAFFVMWMAMLLPQLRRHKLWCMPLISTIVVLGLTAGVDLLIGASILPRTRFAVGEIWSPLALLPLAWVCSLVAASLWVRQRWGEPIDGSTRLMPRDAFLSRINIEIARSRRTGYALSVALLRVGSGQASNEIDDVRERAVDILRHSLRQVDVLSYFDRETLALMLSDTEEHGAVSTVDRLRRTVAEAIPAQKSGRLHTWAGVAQYKPTRHTSPQELLQEAQAALFAAFSEGGNLTATAP